MDNIDIDLEFVNVSNSNRRASGEYSTKNTNSTKNTDNTDNTPQKLISLSDSQLVAINKSPETVLSNLNEVMKNMETLMEVLPKNLFDELLQFKFKYDSYLDLDQNLIEILEGTSGDNGVDGSQLYDRDDYTQIANNIHNTSTVIYFKSANMFKVYTPEAIREHFSNQLRCNYKKTDEIYEIVDRSRPQKVIIVIDGSIENELNKIRDYVYAFFNSHIKTTIHKEDIVSFKNPKNGNLEILVNGLYVKNYLEKEIIIKKLLDYIEDKERLIKSPINLAKIEMRRKTDIPGTDSFLIPERKQIIGKNTTEYLTQYISQVGNCLEIGGTVNITIMGNVTNVKNMKGNLYVADTVVNNNVNMVDEPDVNNLDDIDIFVERIKQTKPNWYTAGKWIHISVLYNNFIETTSSNMNVIKFSTKSKKRLFSARASRTIDGKSGRAVLLYDYEKL